MNHNTETNSGGSGRTALWVVLALALATLAYLTLGLAIPNNPQYSDRVTNGISKYRFLEDCYDGIATSAEMGQVREQLVAQNRVSATDELYAEFTNESKDLVDNVVLSSQPGQTWALSTPVQLHSHLKHEPIDIGPVYAHCYYDKQANQTVVSLAPGSRTF